MNLILFYGVKKHRGYGVKKHRGYGVKKHRGYGVKKHLCYQRHQIILFLIFKFIS